MRTAMASLALALVAALPGSARAQITWSFINGTTATGYSSTGNPPLNGTPVTMGNSASFYDQTGTHTLGAASYQGVTLSNLSGGFYQSVSATASTGTGNQLAAKNDGGSGYNAETGLGLNSDTSHEYEITYGKGIVLNFAGYTAPYTIHIGSVQSASGDLAGIYAYNTTTNMGTFLGTVGQTTSGVDITVGASAGYTIMVTEYSAPHGSDTNPNVLLGAVTVTSAAVPEPSTMAIAAVGAIGFIGYGLRRRKARTA